MLQRAGLLIGLGSIVLGCVPSFGGGFGGELSIPPLEQRETLGAGAMLAFTRFDFSSFTSLDTALILLDDEHGLRDLYHSNGFMEQPVFAPDGARLAFVTHTPAGQATLHVMRTDGSDHQEFGGELVGPPRWSPDGSRLALLSFETAADGSTKSNLLIFTLADANTTSHPLADVWDFIWLPEGDLLVLERDNDTLQASTYQPDGTLIGQRPLAIPQDAWYATLSPDGTQIAYSLPQSDPDVLTDPLFVADLSGGDPVPVGDLWFDGAVVWSPDGSQLAAITLTDNSYYTALYVVNADGSDRRQLMVLDVGDESGEIFPGVPAWSPDRTRIAIGSTVDIAGSAVFVLMADGSDLGQITNASGAIYDLAWRP